MDGHTKNSFFVNLPLILSLCYHQCIMHAYLYERKQIICMKDCTGASLYEGYDDDFLWRKGWMSWSA